MNTLATLAVLIAIASCGQPGSRHIYSPPSASLAENVAARLPDTPVALSEMLNTNVIYSLADCPPNTFGCWTPGKIHVADEGCYELAHELIHAGLYAVSGDPDSDHKRVSFPAISHAACKDWGNENNL